MRGPWPKDDDKATENEGCGVSGQMTKASNKRVHPPLSCPAQVHSYIKTCIATDGGIVKEAKNWGRMQTDVIHCPLSIITNDISATYCDYVLLLMV